MAEEANLKCYGFRDGFDDEVFYKEEEFSEFLNKTKENLANMSLNRTPLSMRNVSVCKAPLSPSTPLATAQVLNKTRENLENVPLNRSAQTSTSDADLEFEKFLGSLKKNIFKESKQNNSLSSVSLKNASACKAVQSPSGSSTSQDTAKNLGVTVNKKGSSSVHSLIEVENELKDDFVGNRTVGTKNLYKIFNEKIFSSKLPEDMELLWSVDLRTTAGKFSAMKKGNTYNSCKIILSSKVLTTFERLRDTLLHEMCHAAVFIISQVPAENHGPLWKTWAMRCNLVFPDIEMPQRCHSYELSYPFYYKCSNCEWKIGRHRRVAKLSEKCCPKCRSSLCVVKS